MKKQDVDSFEAIVGRGVHGVITGKDFYLGNLRLTEEHFNCPSEIKATVQRLESQGKTVILLNDGKQVLGLFAVADTVKNSSREAIEQLHELGVKTIMLTGDNPHTAKAIASQVGIDEARGNQLPEDKHRAVEEHSRIGITGMVGDGTAISTHFGRCVGCRLDDSTVYCAYTICLLPCRWFQRIHFYL